MRTAWGWWPGLAQKNGFPWAPAPNRITDFTVGEDVAYVKNPFFRGTEPYFDRILLRGGGTSLEGAQAVLADGTADYSWNVQEDPQVLKEMEDLNIGRLVVAFGSTVERIFINQTNPSPTLGQRRSEYDNGENPHPFLTFTPVTQALSMAIDRQALAEQLYGFAGKPACNIIAGPSDYVSIANDTCLVQDIAGAKALLDANGVVDKDGDGIREYGDVPLHITFQTSDNAVRKATHDLLQEWWGQIGISTDLILPRGRCILRRRSSSAERSNGCALLCRCSDVFRLYNNGSGTVSIRACLWLYSNL